MDVLTEPLRFERRILEKVWGGRSLERSLGLALPPGVPVGETWELVDRADENSMVTVGDLQGITLGQLMDIHGPELMGDAEASPDGRFPLLVKYIDATRTLSVQVHPDEEAAHRLGDGAQAKTEAWYVLDVQEGGALYAGLRPGISRADLADLATGPGIEDALQKWDVRPGDVLVVPGGTVHAIGAGVTLLEVQQNSDTTYRLYDWGRVGLDGAPREIHVQQALDSIRFDRETPQPSQAEWQDASPHLRVAPLVRTRYFAMDALRVGGPTVFDTDESYRAFAVLEGSGELIVSSSKNRYSLVQGDVWLLPARCGEYVLDPKRGELSIVQMTKGS